MTLDEAIAHAREVAKELKKKAELADNTDLNYTSDYCLDCAKDHEQLASWLEELKARREAGLAQGKQDRPKGEWIEYNATGKKQYMCSECSMKEKNPKIARYCYWCGADMRGGAE